MRSSSLRCLLAVPAVGLALLLRVALAPYGKLPPYNTFYPFVLLVAMLGGIWAGLLTTGLCALAAIYWLLPPIGPFAINSTGGAISLVIFCSTGVCVSVVAELYRRKHEKLAERTGQLEVANAQLQADVTERKRAEEALCQSEARFRAFFETAAVGANELDPNGRFLRVNQRLCEITGYSHEELLGMGPADLTHPEDRGCDQERLTLYLREHSPVYDAEKRYIRKDGSVIWVHVTAAMIRDAEGKFLRSAGVIQDITARKRAEETLLRSEKLASVGRMAATIAHEINNPLAAVTNTLYLARTSADLPDSLRQYLDTADEELRRIAFITRQALGFYRESNAPTLMSINAVLDSAVDLLKGKIKVKHAVIEKQRDENVQVTAVAGELRQVFSNLLTNSLDAIDEKGVITLRVSTGLASKNGGRCVRVTVADNGKGIDATLRQRIFEPFFTTKDTTGTGLGLWVSKQIIDKHGGIIRMRSSTDGVRRGTVFSIVLPLEPAAEAHIQSAGA
jgi:PAS domain S-box-containing protein